MEQTNLETILSQEREKLVSAALQGEFGSLGRYYDPFEQRVMYAAQTIQHASVSVKQLAYSVKQTTRSFFGNSRHYVQTLLSYIPRIEFVDDKPLSEQVDNDQIQLTSLQQPEKLTEPKHSLRVVSHDNAELSGATAATYSGKLYNLVGLWVKKRVARDIIPRTYTHLTQAEQTLSENVAEIERNVDVYSRKRERLLEQSLRIGRDLGQRESELAVLEKEEQALDDDHETARQLSQAHLANDHAYSDPKTAETAEQYGRLLPVIKQKRYDSQRRYTQLDQSIERDKRVLAQITDEVNIINEGITNMEAAYKTVQANKRDVTRSRALLEQRTATYKTWAEVLQYAQNIPRPVEVTPIVAKIEEGTRRLKEVYGTMFGVHVIYDKEKHVIERTPGVM